MPSRIQVYGMFGSEFSLGAVAAAFARCLVELPTEVLLHNFLEVDARWAGLLGAKRIYGSSNTEFADPMLGVHTGHDPHAEIGLFIGPTTYAPQYLKHHRMRIAALVCETTAISRAWVEICNDCDLVIVPSQFCKAAFRSSGVTTQIRIVNHGLEPEFTPHEDVRQREDVFEFFNTFGVYAPPQRKGCEELIRAFMSAFRDRDDTSLRLRTHLRGPVMEYVKRYSCGEKVLLEPLEFVRRTEYAKLLCSAHCVVCPSRGEGFGLVPFHAIACETPVIAPMASGMTEYLSRDWATAVKTRGLSKGPSWDNQPGRYFNIDEDHLSQQMIHLRDNWALKKRAVAERGESFRKKFAWPRVLTPLKTWLSQALQEPARSQCTNELHGWL